MRRRVDPVFDSGEQDSAPSSNVEAVKRRCDLAEDRAEMEVAAAAIGRGKKGGGEGGFGVKVHSI